MAGLDHLVAEAEQSGLGAAATAFVQEAVALVLGGVGGLAGLIDKLHATGLGDRVTAWFAGAGGHELTGAEVEKVFDGASIAGLAHRLGLAREQASTMVGWMLPKIMTTLAPGGILSPSAMAEARDLAGAMPPPLPSPTVAAPPRLRSGGAAAIARTTTARPQTLAAVDADAVPTVRSGTVLEKDPLVAPLLLAAAIALACAAWALKDPEPGPVVPPAHFEPLYPPVPAAR